MEERSEPAYLASSKVGPQKKMHIPKAVMQALQLEPGDHLGFYAVGGRVIVVKL